MFAAHIGPTVWELEGPKPIFSKSNTLICIIKTNIIFKFKFWKKNEIVKIFYNIYNSILLKL